MVGGGALLVSLLTRRWRAARDIALGLSLLLLAYAGVLLGDSLVSHDTVLGEGELKYFCETDCHEAYSVVDVRTAKSIGSPPHQANARGLFYVATIRIWFDPHTIGPHRGHGPLHPNSHEAWVVDDSGRSFAVSPEAQQAYENGEGPALPLTRPIRPGESYETVRVFDLPGDVQNPRLFITNPDWITRFMIGHENSFFHGKAYFALPIHPTAERREVQVAASRLVSRIPKSGLGCL